MNYAYYQSYNNTVIFSDLNGSHRRNNKYMYLLMGKQ